MSNREKKQKIENCGGKKYRRRRRRKINESERNSQKEIAKGK